MSVPLDRLYNYLNDIVNDDILIYRWVPHGSKKLEDLRQLSDLEDQINIPIAIAHDQEPLDYYQYSREDVETFRQHVIPFLPTDADISPNFFWEEFQKYHWRIISQDNIYPLTILIHSERNSNQVGLYRSKGYVPVYYWSHAIIARDWFRFAEHDPILDQPSAQKPFLIYNRAWAGSREYRLTFADLIVKNGLSLLCKMGFNSVDGEQHYFTHEFKNPALRITSTNLESYFFKNTATAEASADYNALDYQETMIEVVLETLFDDTRQHLTEKTLRPIACGHPFILAATPNSLQYLRSYGFETFDGLIDETYDTISDPIQRLHAIVSSMKQLLTADANVHAQLKSIAARNKKRFFSAEFQQHVIDEFKSNFDQALLSMIPSHSSGGGSAI